MEIDDRNDNPTPSPIDLWHASAAASSTVSPVALGHWQNCLMNGITKK